MKKIAVLISGSGSNLEAIIKSCNSNLINAEVVSVISNDSDAYGLIRANNLNVNTKIINHNEFTSRNEFEKVLEDYLDELNVDLIVLAGFMRILGKKIVNKFSSKMINLHPSLLPLYPGLNTHEKALFNNDKEHGISIHFVSTELDAGPIIAQGIININNDEKIETLVDRIHKIEHKLLPKIIGQICEGNIYIEKNIVKFKNINLKDKDIYIKKYEI